MQTTTKPGFDVPMFPKHPKTDPAARPGVKPKEISGPATRTAGCSRNVLPEQLRYSRTMASLSSSRPPDFKTAFARVERLRRAGQPAEAEQLCRQLLQQQPASVAVLNALAMLLADRGQLGEAKALLQSAISLSPDEAVLHNNLGNILYQDENLAGAEQAYRKAVALKADYTESWFNLGVICSALDRREEAFSAYERVVAIAPDYWRAQVQIGAILHQKGDNDAALKALDAAMPAATDYYDAHYYRGTVLHALKRYDDAIAAFGKAIALKPLRFESHFALAGTLAATGREDQAIRSYKRAIEAQPDYLPAHREYNNLVHAMGRDVRALQSYAFGRSQAGDTSDLLLAEAELMLRLNDGAGAERLLRLAPQDRADVANALGRALTLDGRFEDAAEILHRAVRAEPMTVTHYLALAVTLLRAGLAAPAQDVLLQALALDPHHQATLGYLTLAYRQLGKPEFSKLFDPATLVREYQLAVPAGFADPQSFNSALAGELARLHTRRVAPIDQTLQGGTQTAAGLFDRDVREIRLLRDAVQEAVADYIKSLPADAQHPFLSRRDSEFHFSGSWSCRLASGGFHTNHIHEEGWISSAYYAALPDDLGAGGEGALNFGQSSLALGEEDRPGRTVQPQVGKLVLFPSYYWHGTTPFHAEQSRLAVAFDVLPGRS